MKPNRGNEVMGSNVNKNIFTNTNLSLFKNQYEENNNKFVIIQYPPYSSIDLNVKFDITFESHIQTFFNQLIKKKTKKIKINQ